jgi:hypothetical protein
MLPFGITTRFAPKDDPIVKTTRYMKAAGATDRTLNWLSGIVGYDIGAEVEYIPQKGLFAAPLKTWLGATTGAVDTTPPSIMIGVVREGTSDKYFKYVGMIGEKLTITIPRQDYITVKGTLIGASGGVPSGTTYIGTGSHAAMNDGDAFTGHDITSLQINTGSAYSDFTDAVNEIVIEIENLYGMAGHLGASNDARIGGYALTGRKITWSLDMDYDDFSMYSNIRSLTSNKIKLVLDDDLATTTTLESTGLKFPKLPFEWNDSDDLIGDKITSEPCTGFTIATT